MDRQRYLLHFFSVFKIRFITIYISRKQYSWCLNIVMFMAFPILRIKFNIVGKV